ncbi:hypothetical protein HO640_02260 [Streptococcus suis]|uniref:Uncharacterized protein n=1 Tax=Streptococcus suis TaxID=1307 RepID=A0A123SYE7_STRSU|nr:hypothetical protein [Streptococcus suis]NQH77749.1 hypothetical protein [Streptococcus suis]CYU69480.1 Uncharacterised protein [Streptococcus suis]
MSEDVAIILPIFDGYEDMWEDCIRLIKKNWKDHPAIYVFSNVLQKDWEGVTCIPVGEDAEWSKKIQKAIDVVDEKYFILMLEDFFIGDVVKANLVDELIAFMEKNGIDFCKLCDNNNIVKKRKDKFDSAYPYQVIFEDEEYGISLQTSIWRKTFLEKLVGRENYNAWQFELNQVKIARNANHIKMQNAIFDPRNILNIKHGALQGQLLPPTVKYFEKIGNPLNCQRPIMTRKTYLQYWIKQLGRDLTPKVAKGIVKSIGRQFGMNFVEDKWMTKNEKNS